MRKMLVTVLCSVWNTNYTFSLSFSSLNLSFLYKFCIHLRYFLFSTMVHYKWYQSPKSMDERMKKLEAQMIELHNKVDTRSQTTHDLMEQFAVQLAQITSQMSSWREDMMETIRLNRPPPPVIDPTGFSSVQGRGKVHSNHSS